MLLLESGGGWVDFSMSLLRMSISGREGGVGANLANVTKFTVHKRQVVASIPHCVCRLVCLSVGQKIKNCYFDNILAKT